MEIFLKSVTSMATKFKIRDTFGLLKETYNEWNEDKPFDMSSSVAYYAIFSLPALLLIIIAIAGLAFGREAVQGRIANEIGGMMGKNSAKDIQEMVTNAYKSSNTVISAIIGIVTLLLGSTAVFLQLQTSLNTVWRVKTSPKAGIKKLILDRATALGVIMAIGFMLLISLVVTTALSALSDWISARLPDFFLYAFYIINILFAFGTISFLFALIFKVLPDAKIPWKSVWVGAFVTAFLFEIGRFSLGLYFGKSDPASGYGAAGSVILIMLWVYYSCLILFFGAAFTKVFSSKYGLDIHVSENAVKVEQEEHVKEETKIS
jgi:membrane protein